MVAATMQAAETARSLEDFFFRLENVGIMLRIDRSLTPTMAKTPTLALWELEILRSIEHVIHLGHVERVERGRIVLSDGAVEISKNALVIHCVGAGLIYRPLIPIWSPEMITVQPVRAGFPCYGAALIGFVEATRDNDEEKNLLCRPSPYPDSLASWAEMTVIGAKNTKYFSAEPDIASWATTLALNPARVPSTPAHSPALDDALTSLDAHGKNGMARLTELAGL